MVILNKSNKEKQKEKILNKFFNYKITLNILKYRLKNLGYNNNEINNIIDYEIIEQLQFKVRKVLK